MSTDEQPAFGAACYAAPGDEPSPDPPPTRVRKIAAIPFGSTAVADALKAAGVVPPKPLPDAIAEITALKRAEMEKIATGEDLFAEILASGMAPSHFDCHKAMIQALGCMRQSIDLLAWEKDPAAMAYNAGMASAGLQLISGQIMKRLGLPSFPKPPASE